MADKVVQLAMKIVGAGTAELAAPARSRRAQLRIPLDNVHDLALHMVALCAVGSEILAVCDDGNEAAATAFAAARLLKLNRMLNAKRHGR